MVAVDSAVGNVWSPRAAVAVTLMSVFGVLSSRSVETITTRPYVRLRQERSNLKTSMLSSWKSMSIVAKACVFNHREACVVVLMAEFAMSTW